MVVTGETGPSEVTVATGLAIHRGRFRTVDRGPGNPRIGTQPVRVLRTIPPILSKEESGRHFGTRLEVRGIHISLSLFWMGESSISPFYFFGSFQLSRPCVVYESFTIKERKGRKGRNTTMSSPNKSERRGSDWTVREERHTRPVRIVPLSSLDFKCSRFGERFQCSASK